MDGQRTLYVFRWPRNPRERNVLWLPIDLAMHYGFWIGAILFVAGGVFLGISLIESDYRSFTELWPCVSMIAGGVFILVIVNRVQRLGRRPDHELIIRRAPRR